MLLKYISVMITNIMFDVLSGLKFRKLNIKPELIKYYKMMLDAQLQVGPDQRSDLQSIQTEGLMSEICYEDQCSRQAEGIYKIGYKAISFNGVFMSMSIL